MTNNIRVTAKKSLGQHFLVNEGVLDRIVESADITSNDTVVEIGPGTGTLTRRLAATGARVIAIEKDARLIAPLRELFVTTPNVTVEEGDIMKFEIENLKLKAGSYKVVANIPYYLTSHLIRLVLEEWPAPSRAVLMVQSEVADRMMATPPDMNLLALSVQLYAKPSRIMKVSRGSFRPVPDVDSAVIRLDIPVHDDAAKKLFVKALSLAKAAFSNKRKQLTAHLPAQDLQNAEIDPSKRPQELDVQDWLRLASALH